MSKNADKVNKDESLISQVVIMLVTEIDRNKTYGPKGDRNVDKVSRTDEVHPIARNEEGQEVKREIRRARAIVLKTEDREEEHRKILTLEISNPNLSKMEFYPGEEIYLEPVTGMEKAKSGSDQAYILHLSPGVLNSN